LIQNPHVDAALEAALGARLRLNNREALVAAADAVGAAANEFAVSANGAELAAIDSLLPRPEQYR
jgi:uncharacterized protein (DUF1778 family)